MLSLTEFLLARIAEEQAVARDFIGEGPWQAWAVRDAAGPRRDDEYAQLTVGAARVLVDSEAKRRIVELHAIECYPDDDGDWYCCDGCSTPMVPHPSEVACPTLKALALPYADHPDFQEEWRP